MKIKLVSDLHLEFNTIELPQNGADVLVIAGDLLIVEDLYQISPVEMENRIKNKIGSDKLLRVMMYRDFLKDVSENFKYVVYVMGNHEFYGGRFNKSIDHLRFELEDYQNIFLLENQSIVLDGVQFIGSTLWSDMNKHNPITMYDCKLVMNDYHKIRLDNNDRYRKLDPKDTYHRHLKSVKYIYDTLKNTTKPTVIVTHHAPSFQSIGERYKFDTHGNGAYASSLEELILEFQNIKYWMHGHVHHVNNYMIGDTRVLSNPRGYDGYEHTDWKPNLILEI